MMNEIGIDIETKSGESLKYGVYKYVENPDFKIILFSYSINGSKPHIVDLTARQLPENILSMLQSKEWLKTAYNAQFERVCINKHFGLNIPASQWVCTMILAASVSLPLPLEAVSKVLKVAEKDRRGKDLIRYFSVKTKTGEFRNPEGEKWRAYKEYNLQDVVVEQEIKSRLKNFIPYNPFERRLYLLDQKINDTGVKIDRQLVVNAILINKTYTEELITEAKKLTGVLNPHSVAQLKVWIERETGLTIPSLNKEVKIKTDNSKVLRLLEIRKEISKTSIKKYLSMHNAASSKDNRVRGLFQYGGATRTLRWAGRIVQPQNFVKNNHKDLDFLRELVKDNNLDFLKAYSGNVNSVLSQLLRTAFIPEKGNTFLITDFSAIEARVLSWYAKEIWRLEVFNTHGKIYEEAGSRMFNVPIEKVTKASEYRQRSKIAELALGYQGGVGALMRMGAEKMGISESQCEEIVSKWRTANPKIVRFWYAVQDSVKQAILTRLKIKLAGLTFEYRKGTLFIYLPSGRPLVYLQAKLDNEGRFTYMGMHQTIKKWVRLDSYGGKFVENIVQATARDLLAEALLTIDELGYKIVMHVHDEIVMEVNKNTVEADLEIVDKVMSVVPIWAKGLPLKGDSYVSYYYKKDD